MNPHSTKDAVKFVFSGKSIATSTVLACAVNPSPHLVRIPVIPATHILAHISPKRCLAPDQAGSNSSCSFGKARALFPDYLGFSNISELNICSDLDAIFFLFDSVHSWERLNIYDLFRVFREDSILQYAEQISPAGNQLAPLLCAFSSF